MIRNGLNKRAQFGMPARVALCMLLWVWAQPLHAEAFTTGDGAVVTGAPCDPNVADAVRGCVGGRLCRRFAVGGNCPMKIAGRVVPNMSYNRQCLDDLRNGRATAIARNLEACRDCTHVSGQCEILDRCNNTDDCLIRDHSCIQGLCQYDPPPIAPPPECRNDIACRLRGGPLQHCVDGRCVDLAFRAQPAIDQPLPLPLRCFDNATCGAFHRCVDRRCERITRQCVDSTQCANGKLCDVSGHCR